MLTRGCGCASELAVRARACCRRARCPPAARASMSAWGSLARRTTPSPPPYRRRRRPPRPPPRPCRPRWWRSAWWSTWAASVSLATAASRRCSTMAPCPPGATLALTPQSHSSPTLTLAPTSTPTLNLRSRRRACGIGIAGAHDAAPPRRRARRAAAGVAAMRARLPQRAARERALVVPHRRRGLCARDVAVPPLGEPRAARAFPRRGREGIMHGHDVHDAHDVHDVHDVHIMCMVRILSHVHCLCARLRRRPSSRRYITSCARSTATSSPHPATSRPQPRS